jgi:hypothetical protein
MIQCSECEHCSRSAGGALHFTCDPFKNIKEPECLIKWQLLKLAEHGAKLDRLVRAYEATVAMYKRLAPLQEKMFRHMEREIDEVEESERWKYEAEDGPPGDDDDEASGQVDATDDSDDPPRPADKD